MVVESEAALALALLFGTFAADVAPVVVAEEQRHVVGHGEAGIVIALHLGKDGPELGYGVGASVDVLDDFALTVDYVVKRAHILLVVALSHRHITVAAHADGHEVIVVLIALHTLAEELIDAFLVGGVVPRAYLFLALQVFAV